MRPGVFGSVEGSCLILSMIENEWIVYLCIDKRIWLMEECLNGIFSRISTLTHSACNDNLKRKSLFRITCQI